MYIEDEIKKIISELNFSNKYSLKGLKNFSNGEGYLQHNVEIVNEITNKIIKLAFNYDYYVVDKERLKERLNSVPLEKFRQNSIVGRYLDSTPFWSAWSRLMFID